MNSYTLAMRNYLKIEGRTSRRDFWLFTLIVTGMLLVAVIVDELVFSTPWVERRYLSLLVGLAHIVPFITASVRRLHDADLSGWLYLVNAVPLGQLVFIVLACLPSKAGPNKFGPAPTLDTSPAPTPNPYSVPPASDPPLSSVAPKVAPRASAHVPPVQSTSSVFSEPTNDLTIDKLEKLADLRSQGVIDDAEFANLKSRLLTGT